MPAIVRHRLLVALCIGVGATPAAAGESAVSDLPAQPGSALHCTAERATPDLCARDLLRRVRADAELEYVTAQALQATPAEIEAVRAYELAFRAHDRAQRALKLAELAWRLADPELAATERGRLEEFRAILQRLARYEADVESGVEPRVEPSAAQMAYWIERSKLDVSLYRRYGGVVGLSAAGPYAHGARAALVRDYARVRPIDFPDAEVEAAFWRLLAAPPLIVFRGEAPDFTPFWQRAIPSSYMPE